MYGNFLMELLTYLAFEHFKYDILASKQYGIYNAKIRVMNFYNRPC